MFDLLNSERTPRNHAQNMKKHEFLKISKARKTSAYKSFNGFKLFGFMLTKVDIFQGITYQKTRKTYISVFQDSNK